MIRLMRYARFIFFMPLIQTLVFADQTKFDPIAAGAIPVSKPWPFQSSIKVKVVVFGKDGLDSVVKGYLLEDLQKISDVSITDVTPDYVVSVCVVATTVNGIKTGYGMAYAVTSTVNEKIVKNQIVVLKVRGVISSQVEDQMTFWLNTDGILTDQFVQLTNREELEETCSENIASINADDFQAYRKFLGR